MNRLEANTLILAKLITYFHANPDMRFFQSLQALGLQKSIEADPSGWMVIEDNFAEESIITLEKLNHI